MMIRPRKPPDQTSITSSFFVSRRGGLGLVGAGDPISILVRIMFVRLTIRAPQRAEPKLSTWKPATSRPVK